MSIEGHVVFGHFAVIPDPSYETVFTVSDFERITSDSRQALSVAAQFISFKVLGIMLVLCSAELDPFSCQHWRSNCSTSGIIKREFCFGNAI